jgi:hypothetical protein
MSSCTCIDGAAGPTPIATFPDISNLLIADDKSDALQRNTFRGGAMPHALTALEMQQVSGAHGIV